MLQCLARAAFALLPVMGWASVSLAQAGPRVCVQVRFDEEIKGVRPAAEPPETLNMQLSEALSESILQGGRWFDFCWDLAVQTDPTAAELVVEITKDAPGNWVMGATLTTVQDGVRRDDPFETKIVRSTAELVGSGPISQAELPKELSKWFADHYLTPPRREYLHNHFKRIPVGQGRVGVIPNGTEKFCALYLPVRFKHFAHSDFRFIGDQDGLTFALEAQGTGKVVPPDSNQSLATFVLRAKSMLPGVEGAQVTAYLRRYVEKSEFGGLEQFE